MKKGDPYGQQPRRFQFMTRFDIPHLDRDDIMYLVRWRIIQTPWLSVYLHKINTPDSRPTYHDHPWSFLSILIKGEYWEYRPNPHNPEYDELHHRRWVNIMRRDDKHYIRKTKDDKPVWSLLLVGARRRKWGYWRRVPPQLAGGDRGVWSFTPFDEDQHSREFDRAMERRGR